ncbi:MAG: hypothetical protein ABI652_04915 [Acidobacteriota bacterium]
MRPRLAFAACLLLAVLHTWPLAGGLASRSLNYNADAEQGEWTLSWIARMLPRDPRHLFDGNIFAPERATLAYSEPMIVPALMGAPVRWLGGSPVLTYNVVLIVGLALTAWAGWLVAWRWTGAADAALVAGALTAFNAHLLTRLPHVMAAHAWGIPLSLYLADRLVDRPRMRDGALLALVVAATAATSVYWLALVGVVVAITAVASLRRWRSFLAITGASLAGLVIVAPVLWPYVRLAGSGASRPLESVAQFSATPAGYLTSLSRLHAGWTARFFRDDVNVLFAGVTAIALAAVGVATAAGRAERRRRIVVVVAIATVGVFLSFGPATALYRTLYHWLLPLRGLRAAARFGYLYLVAIALAAGLGVAWLQQRARTAGKRALIAGLCLAAVTVEAWSGPIRTEPFRRVPAIYDVLAREAGPALLVEVPFYPADAVFENGEYMLNATAHWQPVMNGTSGVTPASYRARAASFWFFPRDWAIDAIVRDGATHVMVHLERFSAAEVADINQVLARRADLRLVASDAQGHRLYRVATRTTDLSP